VQSNSAVDDNPCSPGHLFFRSRFSTRSICYETSCTDKLVFVNVCGIFMGTLKSRCPKNDFRLFNGEQRLIRRFEDSTWAI
jgi:hypothetical protein